MAVFDAVIGFIGGVFIAYAAVLPMPKFGRITGICDVALALLTGRDFVNMPGVGHFSAACRWERYC